MTDRSPRTLKQLKTWCFYVMVHCKQITGLAFFVVLSEKISPSPGAWVPFRSELSNTRRSPKVWPKSWVARTQSDQALLLCDATTIGFPPFHGDSQRKYHQVPQDILSGRISNIRRVVFIYAWFLRLNTVTFWDHIQECGQLWIQSWHQIPELHNLKHLSSLFWCREWIQENIPKSHHIAGWFKHAL